MTTTSFRILLTGAVGALLIGCGGGPSDAPQATQPAPTSQKITLSGIVTDNPIVNASVMVRVADAAFGDSPPTGSNGEFSVEISSNTPSALITAEAFDAVNGVKLSAVLDTYSAFAGKARNGVVNGVMITNVTTALQILAEQLAADGRIDSFGEYHDLAGQVDAGELFELAAALKVVIENIDGSVLPSGIEDTAQLARMIAAGESSFLADVAVATPGALDEARDRLLTDGNATLPFTPDSTPGVYRSINDQFIYAVFADGSALVDNLDDNAVPGTPSWSLNSAGQLVVRYIGFERETDSLTAIGEVGDVMHMVRQSDFGNAVATDADGVRKHAFGPAYDAAQVPGSWIDGAMETSRWVFEAGGTGYRINTQTQLQSDDFSWSVTAHGRIDMAFDGTDESMQFARLGDDDTVLQISRFNGLYAYLDISTLTQE